MLTDEQFGSEVAHAAHELGVAFAMPVEKSGQNEFDFEYGEQFAEHIDEFDPTFSKVLVRMNVEGDREMNNRQTERLARLGSWLHENDRKYLFELLVPAEKHSSIRSAATATGTTGSCGRADGRRHRRAVDGGVEPDIWKIEGLDTTEDCDAS